MGFRSFLSVNNNFLFQYPSQRFAFTSSYTSFVHWSSSFNLACYFNLACLIAFLFVVVNVLWICISSLFNSFKDTFDKSFGRLSSFLRLVVVGVHQQFAIDQLLINSCHFLAFSVRNIPVVCKFPSCFICTYYSCLYPITIVSQFVTGGQIRFNFP